MELSDRMQVEDEFKTAFLRLSMKHRRQLRVLIGDPPTLERIPQEFWDRVADEQRDEMLAWLIFAFMQSARQHGEQFGLTVDQARDEAYSWARGQVSLVLLGYVAHSRVLLGRIGSTKQSRETVLDRIFGDDRADKMAATQITMAASAGSEYATALFGNQSGDDLWFTKKDELVCGYCGPLHLRPRREWLQIYQNVILPSYPGYAAYGPPRRTPAHVRCRCFVSYAFETQASGVAA